MVSNADIESRWIDAWNALADIVRDRRNVPCMLPDFSIVDVETCQGWLQDSVYGGYLVSVTPGWVGHLRGVIASRSEHANHR